MTSTSTKARIILYDLSSTLKPEFWSPNTGTIRTLFNYLQIEYDLRFVRYPDIVPTLRSIGIKSWDEQNIKEHAPYTLPALTFIINDKEESVMGSRYQIVDKINEVFNFEYNEKIFLGQEELVKCFCLYNRYISMIIYPVIGPFIYNILDDDETKLFYRETRLAKGRGDMFTMMQTPVDELMTTWNSFKEELYTFKSFAKFAKDSGYAEDKIELFSHILTKFQKNESKYILGDLPCFADFAVFALLWWCRQSMVAGCPKFQIIDDNTFWKSWYDSMLDYNI